MEQEIIETYTFNPEDYHDGRRKSDSMTFRDVVKEFERDFHQRHSCEYALNLYANSATMHLLEKSCNAASFLSYGMDLTQGNAFDAEQDPYINHAIRVIAGISLSMASILPIWKHRMDTLPLTKKKAFTH